MEPLNPKSRIELLTAEAAHLKEQLRRVQSIGLVGSVEVDLRNNRFINSRSPEYLLVHGLPPEAANETHDEWLARVHPLDRDRMRRHFGDAVAGSVTDYTAEYRVIRPSDRQTRWIFCRGVIERDGRGQPVSFLGAHLDITDRRTAEEATETLSRELAHSIENTGTVLVSLIRSSARADDRQRAFGEALAKRLESFFAAKSLIRPTRFDEAAITDLHSIFDIILGAYRDPTNSITIRCPTIAVGADTATAIALAIHELATNAVKYGSLSVAHGRLNVDVRMGENDCVILWVERGGPVITVPPSSTGFGTELADRTLGRQMKAEIIRDWSPEGLQLRIELPAQHLVR